MRPFTRIPQSNRASREPETQEIAAGASVTAGKAAVSRRRWFRAGAAVLAAGLLLGGPALVQAAKKLHSSPGWLTHQSSPNDNPWGAGEPLGITLLKPLAPIKVAPGKTAQVQVLGTDRDLSPDGALVADAIHYRWDCSQGTLIKAGGTAIWTAPNELGTYTVTATATDDGTEQYDDEDKSVTVSIEVVERTWEPGAPIDLTVTPADNTQVAQGHQVTLNSSATDSDHWVEANAQGDEPDTAIAFTWSDGSTGDTLRFTPDHPGTFTFTVTASNGGSGKAVDPDKTATVHIVVPEKTWTKGDDLTVGLPAPAGGLTVAPGTVVPLSATHSDNDHWEQADQQGDEADEVTPSWAGEGVSGEGWTATWTAPGPGTYTVSVSGSDNGTARFDDADKTAALTFTVPEKTWSKGDDIQLDWIDSPPGGTVDPGDVIHLAIDASDSDHWDQADQHGDAGDALTAQWDGAEPDAGGLSATWTAPDEPGDYFVAVTASDDGTTQYDDGDKTISLMFTVPEKAWAVGDPITVSIDGAPEGAIKPGARVKLNAAASDGDHWQQGTREGDEADSPLHYVWSVSEEDASTVYWTAPEQPGDYEVTVTANDDGTSRFADGSVTSETVTITVEPDEIWTWSPDPALNPKEISTPRLNVHLKDTVPLWVVDATNDEDTRTNQDGEAVTESSGPNKYTWQGGEGGHFQSTNGVAAVWTAPATVDANGEDFTISCDIDDDLDGDSGVTEPDQGSRDDDPVTTNTITIHVMPNGCGDWHHDRWDEATGITWEQSGSGTPVPQTPIAHEHIKWIDSCDAADVKDPKMEKVFYRKTGDRAEVEAGVTYRRVTYQAFSGYGGPPTAVLTDRQPYVKHWFAFPNIAGGEISPLAEHTVLGPGETIRVGVGAASDTDSWQQGPSSGTAQDGVRYTWTSNAGGTFTEGVNSASAVWKAPAEADIPAGAGGLTVTLSCFIDDSFDEDQNGVVAPEAGDRNDGPLPPRSVTFKVLRSPCGRWMHKGWLPGTGITWDTDSNGDPTPIDPPAATEILKWVDDCAGTTKPDSSVKVPYTKISDGPVQENGVWRRKVQYLAYSTCPESPSCPETGALTSERDLPKHWSADTPLDPGSIQATVNDSDVPVTVPPATADSVVVTTIPKGAGLDLEVIGASDSDNYWYWGVGRQSEDDEVKVTWRASLNGGAESVLGVGDSLSWTPSAAGTYSLKAVVDDPWEDGQTGVEAPALGNRNDGSVALSLVVRVVAKKWEVGEPLSTAIAEVSRTKIFAGDTVTFTVTSGDIDHWTQGTSSGDEDDEVAVSYLAENVDSGSRTGTGDFVEEPPHPDGHGALARAVTWTAPLTPGNYDLIASGSDDGTGRFDDTNQSARFRVEVTNEKIWEHGADISLTLTGGGETPTILGGHSIVFTAAGGDSDVWRMGAASGTEGDPVKFAWNSSGGEFTSITDADNNSEATWKAPRTPGTYTISVWDYDGDARYDDEEQPERTISVTVTADSPRTWSEGEPLAPGTLDGAENGDEQISGEELDLLVTGAHDADHWAVGPSAEYPAGHEENEADEITYEWSVTGPADSEFVGSEDGEGATWLVPDAPGDYVISVRVNDVAETEPGDTGDRDDMDAGGAVLSVTVHVSPRTWSVGSPVSATRMEPEEQELTSKAGNPVVFTVEGSDSDTWHQGVRSDDEDDEIQYKWAVDGAAVVGDANTPGTLTWTPPTNTALPHTFTITCAVDDDVPDTTVRFDDDEANQDTESPRSVTWSVTVQPASLVTILARRKSSSNDMGGLATVAGGHLDTDEHSADLQFHVVGTEGAPIVGQPIDLTPLSLSGHKGVKPDSNDPQRDMADEVGSLDDGAAHEATVSLTAVTDADGNAVAQVKSSNRLADVTITYDNTGDNDPSVKVSQSWTNRTDWGEPLFSLGGTSTIVFKPRFLGKEDPKEAAAVPIRGHNVVFKVVAVRVGDPNKPDETDDIIFKLSRFDADGAGIVNGLPKTADYISQYARVEPTLPSEDDPANGAHAFSLRTAAEEDGVAVKAVWVQAIDLTVWKEKN